jgi:hypothetical protein
LYSLKTFLLDICAHYSRMAMRYLMQSKDAAIEPGDDLAAFRGTQRASCT